MTKYQIKIIKKLLGEACRLRDGNQCLRCGKTTTLQTSHIKPTGRYRKMAYDLDNVKTLCVGCHLYWWHKDPLEASEWLKTAIPEARLKKLHLRAITTDKTILDYKLIKLDLENEIRKYG